MNASGGGEAPEAGSASALDTAPQPLPQRGPVAQATDACTAIVQCLLQHRKGGDESFSKSAIQSLVKKMKEKGDELQYLISAVTSNGATPTGCVTIAKTLDGRLQVASRKGFPHAIYAKIWRWPDLHKNELRQAEFCQYGFDNKEKDLVCVNPYHYNRVIGPGLDLSSLSLAAAASAGAAAVAASATEGAGSQGMWPPQGGEWANGSHPAHYPGGHTQFPPSDLASGSQNNGHPHLHASHNGGPTPDAKEAAHWFSNSKSNTLSYTASQNSVNGQNIHKVEPSSSQAPVPGPSQDPPRPMTSASVTSTASSAASNALPLLISRQPIPEHWCSITYFEKNNQIGETFKVPSKIPSVNVDGYFEPNRAGRFSLGPLNNVCRTEDSEKTRKYIGKGIHLECINEGDVWLRCASDYPVFTQSYYLDREAGREAGDAVHKLHPHANTKVFDLTQCYEQMRYLCMTANSAAAAQNAAMSGQIPGYSGISGLAAANSAHSGMNVDDLGKLCILRMSFVKGWGPDYANRPTIKDTPCWIEVRLHRALQLCDEVLQEAQSRKRAGPNSISD